jgi:hypothetical protein
MTNYGIDLIKQMERSDLHHYFRIRRINIHYSFKIGR